MRYVCCDERRLLAVKEAGVLNGIEYVEVSDSEAPTQALRQRTLFVRLLEPAPALTKANVTIAGGERIATVEVEWIAPATALPAGESTALVAGLEDPSRVLLVRTASRGDFSRYVLRLVAGAGDDSPPAGFDPLLASVEFSFKVECPSDFDCKPDCDCPPEQADAPSIDYLAKDFSSFRALMLDRLSLLAPEWMERTPADAGVALVEALAYVADELSYRQDAVATEAYLATSRRRTSLRRHARLVDYLVHEGSNARAWVRVFSEQRGRRARPRHAAPHARAGRPGRDRARRPRASRRARGRGGDLRDRRGCAALRVARALRLLDVGRRGLLPAARRDLGHARRRSSRAEGRRRARAGGGRRSRDRQPRRRRPGEACRRPPDARLRRGRPLGRPLRRPADERRGRGHRDRLGQGRRAALPALHLGGGEAGPGRRRGVGERRARRPRPHDPRRGARRGSRRGARRGRAARLRPVRAEAADEGAGPLPADARRRARDAGAAAAVERDRAGAGDGGASRRPRRARLQRARARLAGGARLLVRRRARGRARRRRRLVGLGRASPSPCCASTPAC